MANFINKTFGGLEKRYLLRQYFFGLVYGIFLLVMPITHFKIPESILAIILVLIMWGLYPYSRFVYESIIDFIMGDNIIFSNLILFLFVKIITMGLCFVFSIFIAPFGLLYLYFYHSRLEKQSKSNIIDNEL
ncbi:hypothetical protein JMI89_08155 [Frischella sp. Ac48]|uniref:Uncharacterized protein n=1 Tax=Frischella japonica TaxID=2741544 RepID=A0ABR7R0N7_9GAMM|nr:MULTISPECIES: hypothetical protein [Frischella]MBC9132024.1 hypothetical protein [Frischella japonica]MBX4133603.1 hypothetical protein [Frischella sp. Ac48]